MRKHSLEHLVVSGKVEGRRARGCSKTEVSRQLVYMLGGQSEPDTCRSSGLQRTELFLHQMLANVVHDGMAP